MNNANNKLANAKLISFRVITYIFLILLVLMSVFFFFILFVQATKSNDELTGVFSIVPSTHFFENLNNVWNGTRPNIQVGLRNSFVVALFSSVLTTYFSALTAYGVYAFDFKGKRIVAAFILAIMMIPAQLSSVGFVQIAYDYQLRDKLWVIIIPSIAAPATYFYMIQYLKATLPLELVEASRIDGSNEFMTFNRIVLPIMKPAMAVQLIFSFVASWNNLYLPSLLLGADDKQTLPVMLSLLQSRDWSSADAGQVWMVIFLAVLPVVVVYIFISRFIIKGVTAGSVKG